MNIKKALVPSACLMALPNSAHAGIPADFAEGLAKGCAYAVFNKVVSSRIKQSSSPRGASRRQIFGQKVQTEIAKRCISESLSTTFIKPFFASNHHRNIPSFAPESILSSVVTEQVCQYRNVPKPVRSVLSSIAYWMPAIIKDEYGQQSLNSMIGFTLGHEMTSGLLNAKLSPQASAAVTGGLCHLNTLPDKALDAQDPLSVREKAPYFDGRYYHVPYN
jgi:hypothetical protein